MTSTSRSLRQEISAGWLTLLSTMLAYGSGSALFMYTSNFFVVPIQQATGWARADVALGVSLTLVFNAVSMPLIGKLSDAYGPRIIGGISLAGYSVCCFLLGLITLEKPVYYALMVSIAPFFAGTTAVVFARLVASKFTRLRGTALAVMLSGTAVILLPVAPVLAAALTESYRYGFFILGTVGLLVGLPLAMLATRGFKVAVSGSSATEASANGLTWREATRSSTFWQIVVAIFASALSLGGILNQLSPVLSAKGFSLGEVAALASLFVAAVTAGRILVGALLDLVNPALVSAAVMILASAAVLLLGQDEPSILVCAAALVLIGSAMGAEADFAAFFTARYFGQAQYSAILGTISMFIAFGLAAGAYMYGAIYDRVGNYEAALQVSVILFFVSGVSLASLWRTMPFGRASPLFEEVVVAQ